MRSSYFKMCGISQVAAGKGELGRETCKERSSWTLLIRAVFLHCLLDLSPPSPPQNQTFPSTALGSPFALFPLVPRGSWSYSLTPPGGNDASRSQTPEVIHHHSGAQLWVGKQVVHTLSHLNFLTPKGVTAAMISDLQGRNPRLRRCQPFF